MRTALGRLGFSGASETALGATVVKREYEHIMASDDRDVVISSCCHSINLLIRKYFPEALPHLAPVVSPMRAHCAAIKAEKPDAKTVFIGPCISKKSEAEQYQGTVDCVLTFDELSRWFAEEGIEPEKSAGREPPQAGRARLFPIPGGIVKSMTEHRSDRSYIAIDGMQNCISAIRGVIIGDVRDCFIEMSACAGSCVGGPAMSGSGRFLVKDWIAVEASAGELDFDAASLEGGSLVQKFEPRPVRKIFPGAAAVEETLRAMGKKRPEDELNCGSCGYDTCRDKALAVLTGKADITMCLPYLHERAKSFSDTIINNTPNGIIVLDKSLVIQQANRAACAILNIREESDVKGRNVSCVLDPTPVLRSADMGENVYEKRIYLVEYKKYVMQTIIQDDGHNIIIILMRDVTDEEISRGRKVEICGEAIEITDRVIEHQMRTVQEIASLLGETAAETQIALSSLKDTIHNEQFLH
jgi:PAS domain-containing protein